MANVLGEAGRYVTQQAVRKFRNGLTVLCVGAFICAFLGGFALCLPLRTEHASWFLSVLISAALAVAVIFIWRAANRKMDQFEKERINMRKGAVGEAAIAFVLNDFPEDFYVIHDLTTPYGNLDHVVVGPTGVFLVDTKNWKGIVTADGAGDLLVNGKPPGKATVKTVVGRTMGIRDGVIALCKNDPNYKFEMPFFHVVLAFPSATVEAKWGSTGSADCVSDENLWGYIVESRKGKPLTKVQVETLANAFRAFAGVDKGFESQPSE